MTMAPPPVGWTLQNGFPTPEQQYQQQHQEVVTRFDDCYSVDKRLQSGNFGVVYRCRQSSETDHSKSFAVKVIDRTKLDLKSDQSIFREISILYDIRELDHITKLWDFFVTPEAFYVVLTYCKGGDVFERLSGKTEYGEKDARDLAKNLLQTMELLHLRKLAHRDLKPENLLLEDPYDDSNIVLCDFGMAAYVYKNNNNSTTEGKLTTRCGTPPFCAPEIVNGIPYDERVDMWSVGCLLYMLLSGKAPFQAPTYFELFRKIRVADYHLRPSHFPEDVSLEARQLIASLLQVDPYYRATATQALQSDWIQMPEHALSDRDLFSSIGEMQLWTSKRTFKGANHTVMITNSLAEGIMKNSPDDFNDIGEQQHSLPVPQEVWVDASLAVQDLRYNQGLEMGKASSSTGSSNKKKNKKKVRENPSFKLGSSSLIAKTHGSNQKFEDVYELGQQINFGGYSTVWECFHRKHKTKFAVKIIPYDENTDTEKESKKTLQDIHREVAILQNLEHSGIVALQDFFQESDCCFLVLEHVEGGDIFQHVHESQHPFTEQEAQALIRNLLLAIQHMHSEGVIHRDLKLRNIILQNQSIDPTDMNNNASDTNTGSNSNQHVEHGGGGGDNEDINPSRQEIKICGFGLSRIVHAPRTVTRCCGTPIYMAPEVWKQVPYDQSADMWSVGVILYMLLCGHPPFPEGGDLSERVVHGVLTFPEEPWSRISSEAKELIRDGLLVVEPLQRFTAEEALQSSWIQHSDDSLDTQEPSESLHQLQDQLHNEGKKKHKDSLTGGTGHHRKNSLLKSFKAAVRKKKGVSKRRSTDSSDNDSVRIMV